MSATGQRVHDVILRGGRTLRLRPPTEEDADGVRRFLTELSPLWLKRPLGTAIELLGLQDAARTTTA